MSDRSAEYIALSLSDKNEEPGADPWDHSTRQARAAGSRPLRVPLLVASLFALCVFVTAALVTLRPDLVLAATHRPAPLLTSRNQVIDSLYGINSTRKSWLDHFGSLNDRHLAPATKETQRFIYEWQNPPLHECDQKKFVLFSSASTRDSGHGLGSLVHIAGYMLVRAIEDDRILAWHDNALGQMFFEQDCADRQGFKSLECMTEKLTSCPRSSMTANNSIEMGIFTSLQSAPAQVVPTVPSRLLDEASHVEWTPAAKKYWWRAQSSAYILRLNKASLDYVARARLDSSARQSFSLHGDQNVPVTGLAPYPLPAGTANIHVRHGDKSIEMKLVPFRSYLAGAENLATLNPLYYSRTAYISSEDPAVFEEAHKIRYLNQDTSTTPNVEWTFYSANIKRLNGGPAMQLETVQNRTEMTLSWMSELFVALECDTWVGTRGSNWNRLIDELRCVYVDKCTHPYIEVNEDAGSWREYNWRF